MNLQTNTFEAIRYVRNLKFSELNRILGAKGEDIEYVERVLSREFNGTVVSIFSARIGIYLALKAYDLSANDEVLIPRHISSCVVDVIGKICKPSYELTHRTKAIVPFHQFGYPQKMDEICEVAKNRNLLVVEDCAHSLSSKYRGARIGSFGEAAVFSFPKIFPTILGGCLLSTDKRILDYADSYLRNNNSFWKGTYQKFVLGSTLINAEAKNYLVSNVFARIVERNWKLFLKIPNTNKIPCHLLRDYLKDLDCYSKKRRANLESIQLELGVDYLRELEEGCEVVPFAVPYICRNPEKMREELWRSSIGVGLDYFDMNRSILSPDFKKVIALPCHQDLSIREIEHMLNVLKNVESKI
jgi:hypothetical protein